MFANVLASVFASVFAAEKFPVCAAYFIVIIIFYYFNNLNNYIRADFDCIETCKTTNKNVIILITGSLIMPVRLFHKRVLWLQHRKMVIRN